MASDRKNDATVIVAIVLIALGAWFLLGNVVPWWGEIARWIGRVVWPLSLIALGVLLYLSSRRGGFGNVDVRGKRLYRSRKDRVIGGVLGGLGAYLSIDPTWLRIGYVLLGFATGGGAVIVYIIAMIAIPEEPESGVEAPVWPQTGGPTPPPPTAGWPHETGRETVQTPPPAPPAPPAPPTEPQG